MNDSQMQKLWILNKAAKQASKNEGIISRVKIEPYLLEILNFIKNSRSQRERIIDYFIELVDDGNAGPYEIIVFCMRELKWPEVYDAVVSRIQRADDPRIISIMNDILAVYEDEWEDEDLYEYYSKEKN